MKIIVNRCYGGFGISEKAINRYAELAGITLYRFTDKRINGNLDLKHFMPYEEGMKNVFTIYHSTKPLKDDGTYAEDSWWYDGNLDRNDPVLVQVVEELGKDANGDYAELRIVEIPDDVKWEIDDYDGIETIHEVHRSW